MNLFIKCSIFHHFWHRFGARGWDIFSISGNALMNHFFSIAICCEKARRGFVRFLRIRCTFSLMIRFFIIFANIWAHILRYFLKFRKCAYQSLLQHRNIFQKRVKRFCDVLWIRCTFALKLEFFIIFGLNLGPRFEIFSQFQKMRLWITFSAS